MEAPPQSVSVAAASPLLCVRCDGALDFLGTKRFQQESDGSLWKAFGELFAQRERFDVYVCPHCGRVEFFVDGVGEEHRSEAPRTERPARPVQTSVQTVEGQLHEASLHESHGQLELAVARYEEVMARYPGTTLAREAEERLRMIKSKLGI